MAWTKENLKELVEEKLKDYLFVVVSNREPYIHHYTPEGIEWRRPASGVTTALDPVMQACGGVWIAHGGGDADRKAVDAKSRVRVPPDDPKYTLRRVWMNKAEESGYYYGFSNETLWPLCHIVYTKPKFDEADWKYYKMINERFAKAVLEEIGDKKAFIFIQDYHLALAPKLIKEASPESKIAQFWHIPWPNPEVFRICPWKEELLQGLLANDLLGFHVHHYADNFLNTIDQNLESKVDRVNYVVTHQGIETLVRPFPISVDFEKLAKKAETPEIAKEVEKVKHDLDLHTEFIGVGVDRLDYTKGIPERIMAIDRFLEKYPQYQGKFTFVQAGVLSRIHIEKYKDLNDEVNDLIEKVNWKYSNNHWVPIILSRQHFKPLDVISLYRMADVCLVSSLHDGMNLVAKEFISAAKPDKGMLVLSQFTGAAKEMNDALLINPYSPDHFADVIKEALEMPKEERKKRMNKLKENVAEANIYRWAAKIIQALLRLT